MNRRRTHDHGKRLSVGHGRQPPKRLIPLDRAIRIALSSVRPIRRTEMVAVPDALRRVVAATVRSRIDVPPADRAAMDGFALLARDTASATPSSPAILKRIEVVYAGHIPRRIVSTGLCTEVATGSVVPLGADAVVRVEDTDREGNRIEIRTEVDGGENVSQRGSDIARGSIVVRPGEVITPAKVGALAAVGLSHVRAYAKPRVSILTTGDEVVPPGQRLRPGQVYDINSNTIASVVRENGGEPNVRGRVADRVDVFRRALRRALAGDLVVVTGGSSVGTKDIVGDVLDTMGRLRFHGIAVKPGRPTAFGEIVGKPVLGMPGNPTSCLSNGYVILAPMVRRMARLPPLRPHVLEVPLARRIVSARGRVEIHTVRIVGGRAVPAYKESGAITSMAHADGFIEIPPDVGRIEAGELVRVILF